MLITGAMVGAAVFVISAPRYDLRSSPNREQMKTGNLAYAHQSDPARLEQYGGRLSDVRVAGCYGYVGAGPRVARTDICNGVPVSITNQTASELLDGVVLNVEVHDEVVFATTTAGSMYVLEMRSGRPSVVSQLPVDMETVAIYSWKNLVYLAGWSDGLLVIDAADPNKPKVIGRYMPEWSQSSAVKAVDGSNGIVYALISDYTDGSDYLVALSANDIDIEELARTQTDPGIDFTILATDGDQVYVGSALGAVMVCHLEESKELKIVSRYRIKDSGVDLGPVADIEVENGGMYVVADDIRATGNGRLLLYRLDSVTQPQLVSRLERQGWAPRRVVSQERRALVVDQGAVLLGISINVDDQVAADKEWRASLVSVSSICHDNRGLVIATRVSGPWLGVASNEVGISLDQVDTGIGLNDVVCKGEGLVGASNDILYAWDNIHLPTAVAAETHRDELGIPGAGGRINGISSLNESVIALYGRPANSRDVNRAVVSLVDVSGDRPRLVGTVSYERATVDEPVAIARKDNFLIVANRRSGLKLIDITELTSPRIVGELELSDVRDVWALEKCVLVASEGRLIAYNLHGTDLVETASMDFPGFINTISGDGEMVIVGYERPEGEFGPVGHIALVEFSNGLRSIPITMTHEALDIPDRVVAADLIDREIYVGMDSGGVLSVTTSSGMRDILLPLVTGN